MVGLGPEQMAEVPTGSPTRQTGVTATALPGGERVHALSLQPQYCLEFISREMFVHAIRKLQAHVLLIK